MGSEMCIRDRPYLDDPATTTKRKKTKHRTNSVTVIQKITGYRLIMFESIPLPDLHQRTMSKRFEEENCKTWADFDVGRLQSTA